MNGICPWAIWLPGPESKMGYNGTLKTHPKVGVALHCMEYESEPQWNDATSLHNALFSGREASWTFSIVKFMGAGKGNDSAILFQHYPIGAVCWAQGYQGNLWLDSIETEGIAPGKFTEPQFQLLVKTLRWIKEAHGWPERWLRGGSGTMIGVIAAPYLFEHNAVPGAPPTDCQVFTHGQVDRTSLLEALQEDEMALTDDDRREISRIAIAEIVRNVTGDTGPFTDLAARHALEARAKELEAVIMTSPTATLGHDIKLQVDVFVIEAKKWNKYA